MAGIWWSDIEPLFWKAHPPPPTFETAWQGSAPRIPLYMIVQQPHDVLLSSLWGCAVAAVEPSNLFSCNYSQTFDVSMQPCADGLQPCISFPAVHLRTGFLALEVEIPDCEISARRISTPTFGRIRDFESRVPRTYCRNLGLICSRNMRHFQIYYCKTQKF